MKSRDLVLETSNVNIFKIPRLYVINREILNFLKFQTQHFPFPKKRTTYEVLIVTIYIFLKPYLFGTRLQMIIYNHFWIKTSYDCIITFSTELRMIIYVIHMDKLS